ncbi:hypothetical protein [Chitinophaga flava]|uniref:Uncharacterized protein n=1 Tax=Chitinophaga flava TaxID=2259036 RepID=A0A365Y420_9BACT|nr:hypothetical protein [Chitinophaga flava]RBL93337.1 hypothetical protein DF182_12490 [Chitinophaga flava]
MKRILLISAVSLSLFACKKDDKDNPTSKSKNTFTYTTGGKTYTVNEGKRITMIESTFIDASINKSANFTTFNLAVEGESIPIEIGLMIDGPLSGLGTYTDVVNGWVKEKYSGGMGYTINAATVNVTEASPNKITGTYQFSLKNASGNKTTTGTFNITQPAQ